jgi:hypothetical protein
VIVGGFGATPQSYSAGVLVNASGGTVTVVDDRIYGGSSAGPSSQTYGVLVRAAGTLLIGNVMVHAGTVANAVGSYTVGVDLSSVASPAIVDTTIYTGSAAGTAIALNPGVTSAVVTDDILLGSDSPLGTFGVAATSCSGLLAVFSYSGLANLAVLYQCTAGDGGVLQATTPVALVAALGTTAAAGDVVLQSVCTVPGCAVVPGCPQPGEGCPTALFEPTWSATDDGVCSLLGSCAADSGVPTDGWTLAAGSPCAVTRGGAPIPNVTTDIYGNARSAKTPTMGAAEYGNATACK